MTNFSVNLSAMSAEQENLTMDDDILHSCRIWFYATDIKRVSIFIFICVACILGLLGNGSVIWLLGFRMKRSPFTIYILNLAVADFGVLIFVILSAAFLFIETNCNNIYLALLVGWLLFHVMFSISQFLLTIISIDRCASVLFPLWYRCHRPEKLSPILCALIWIFCFLVYGTFYLLDFMEVFGKTRTALSFYVLLAVGALCLPLISISSLILVIRFCFKTQQRHRKKLLTAIIFALFFFLFFAFPLNVIYGYMIASTYDGDKYDDGDVLLHHISVGYLCASVNSCVNPLIYFLVGGKKRGLCKESIKLILQRVFKHEEDVFGEELQFPVQSQVSA